MITKQLPYVVSRVAGYAPFCATESSTNKLNRLQAVRRAIELNLDLQSAGQAMVFRDEIDIANKNHDFDGTDFSEEYQVVSTVRVAYWNENTGKVVCGFVELPREKRSLELIEKGMGTGEVVAVREGFIDELVQVAEREKRVVPAQTVSELVLSLTPKKGGSAYERDKSMIALAGGRVPVQKNAGYLRRYEAKVGKLWDWAEAELKGKLGQKSANNVLVSPVGLGGGVFNCIYEVIAYDYFGNVGRARWGASSAKIFSTRNRGSVAAKR